MDRDMITDERLAQVRSLAAVAGARGQSLAQLALAWALRDPRMTSLVLGVSSVAQLEANLAALDDLSFTEDELAAIDRHATDAGVNLWAASSAE
jgi:L-glyceraldehyde 3-phosphate reductase